MNEATRRAALSYARSCHEEELELLRSLARIPAPSHHEGRRERFVRDWLRDAGAENVHVDEAGNVICSIGAEDHDEVAVFCAHTDVVFPDTDELPLTEEDGIMRAPGIGDDTACLAGLMLAARFLLQHPAKLDLGIVIVANSCEEGLGNLEGTKALIGRIGSRVREFTSFDTYFPRVVPRATGSYRYRISCHARGGHSWTDFGERNAIADLCSIIGDLYALDLPTRERTTMNVGKIRGGTTVNSIAQDASALFEFRSTSSDCLDEMAGKLREVIARHEEEGACVKLEVIGVRPGNGDVDAEELRSLTARSDDAVRTFLGTEPRHVASSTDANVPLSLGIPANTIGTVSGGGAHTREEWIDEESLVPGLAVTLSLLLAHCKEME